jgi:NADPH-dependent 2,4-dienoyl-CoA reductase/sulfur reductase-like enzyme
MADEIRKKDVSVTVVELLPQCLALVFDDEFCSRAHEELTKRDIRTVTNSRAEAVVGNGRAEAVRLQSGEELPADLVIFGIGVRPNTDLAKDAGLKIGERGGISVDRYMRTSDTDIFAAGDCAEKADFFTGAPSGLRLASIATSEARIAGANLFRLKRENRGAIGVFSTKIGDMVVGMAGMREKTAREAGFDVVVGAAETIDRHPGCMPGASPLRVKLLFHRDTEKLLGGQACGGVGVGELVNAISALIQGGMTADDTATYQMGTHPALTPSPIAYPLVNAAEIALTKM